MYRVSGPSLLTEARDQSQSQPAGGSDLIACVRNAFPDFKISHFRIDDSGGDHALLIVNETHAFRFPRIGTHSLDLERKLLAWLQTILDLPTPAYDYIDPGRRFAGYRFIRGSALTRRHFAQLPAKTQSRALADIASFLRLLHGVDPLPIAPLAAWPLAWTAAEYAKRASDERLSLLCTRLPKLASLIGDFFEAYRSDQLRALVVVHGDLVTEHILFDDGRQRLAGIIDFGDVALGDPAQDMLGCWDYGPGAVAQLIESYGSDDPSLFARSRNHFIRHRIDRLFEQFRDGIPIDPDGHEVSQLATLLATHTQF